MGIPLKVLMYCEQMFLYLTCILIKRSFLYVKRNDLVYHAKNKILYVMYACEKLIYEMNNSWLRNSVTFLNMHVFYKFLWFQKLFTICKNVQQYKKYS